jgi:hypothetical protein
MNKLNRIFLAHTRVECCCHSETYSRKIRRIWRRSFTAQELLHLVKKSSVMKHRILPALLMALVVPLTCASFVFAHANMKLPPRWKSSAELAKSIEQEIGKVSKRDNLKSLLSAGGHVAWVEENPASTKWAVFLDGKQVGGRYDDVKYPEFSSDGAHFGFFGLQNSHWTSVIDGVTHLTVYTDVSPLVFQPHGSSWAYRACYSENACTMVSKGSLAVMPRETYDEISPPQYSPDGRHLGFLAKFHGKWSAIVDGKIIGPPISSFSCSGFSPDGAHFFMCGTEKKTGYVRWAYYIDGNRGPEFAQIGPIVFSADGAHYAYGGSGLQIAFKKDETSGTIVLDGKPGPSFQGRGLPGAWVTLLDAPIIAAAVYTGGTFVYPAVFVPGHFIASTNVLSASLDGVSDPAFDRNGNLVYAARRGNNDVIMVDGNGDGPSFDDVLTDAVFTADGDHSAYVARRGEDLLAVRDNKPGHLLSLNDLIHRKAVYFDDEGNRIKAPPLDVGEFSVGWAALSPHAAHFAYEITKGGMRFRNGRTPRAERTVVFDGQPQNRYNALNISVVQFTPDERHYWYTVLGADGKKSLAVVDGRETKLYDDMSAAQFDSENNQVVFFARKKDRVVRIAVPLVRN